jgi:hypothetical protein
LGKRRRDGYATIDPRLGLRTHLLSTTLPAPSPPDQPRSILLLAGVPLGVLLEAVQREARREALHEAQRQAGMLREVPTGGDQVRCLGVVVCGEAFERLSGIVTHAIFAL